MDFRKLSPPNEPSLGERLEVYSMNALGRRLYELNFGRPRIASREDLRRLIEEAAHAVPGNRFSRHFLMTEWEQVVEAWQLSTWEGYRDVTRLGRKTRLPENQRALLWEIINRVSDQLRILVSSRLHGSGRLEDLFVKLHDSPLVAPTMKAAMPNRGFLAWHRAEVFRGVPRS